MAFSGIDWGSMRICKLIPQAQSTNEKRVLLVPPMRFSAKRKGEAHSARDHKGFATAVGSDTRVRPVFFAQKRNNQAAVPYESSVVEVDERIRLMVLFEQALDQTQRTDLILNLLLTQVRLPSAFCC